MSPFVPKNWRNETNPLGPPAPGTATPTSAEALEDMETRLSDYADSAAGADIAYGLLADRPAVGSVLDEALYVATDETPQVSGTYEVINVKDPPYNAVGDNVADDTAAIQAALDAATIPIAWRSAALVYIPPGVYKTTSVLSVPDGVGIIGAGPATVIIPTACNGFTFPAGSANPSPIPRLIENFWMEGSEGTSSTRTAFDVPGTANLVDTVRGLEFRNIGLVHFYRGFDLRTLWDSSITNVIGYPVSKPIQIRGQSVRIRIRDCSFSPIGMSPGSGHNGLEVNGASDYNPGGATYYRPEDIQIHGTTLLGYEYGVALEDFLYCIVKDNILDYCGTTGVYFNTSAGLAIKDNYVALSEEVIADGLAIYGVARGSPNAEKASICGNYIVCLTPATTGQKGILLDANQDGHVIHGNLILGFNAADCFDIRLINNKANSVRHNRCTSTVFSIDVVAPTGAHDISKNECASTVIIPISSVASAATVTLPDLAAAVQITGTTTITSVTAAEGGREVTLIFSGVLTFTDGSNLKLAGNFVTTADDTITLVCDGTNWYETARSTN